MFSLVLLMLSTFIPAAAAQEFDARAFLQSPQAGYGDGVHHLGFKPAPPGDYRSAGASRSMSLGLTLSSSVDLSAQLPPVGNQGSQGSCVAWATSYYYKTWSEKREHTGWNLTNTQYQFSPSFVYNQINGGADNGSTFPDAFSTLQATGDVDIAEMPYNPSNYTTQPTAAQLEAAKPYRIPGGWASLWNNYGNSPYANSIANAKSWLNDGKMLVMGIPIYYDFPNFGGNPVKQYYDFNGTAGFAGGHGVAIVGYDDNINPSGSDTDHRGGFKMVNSWGAGWNGGGYVYLSYDFVKRYVWEAWTMSDLTTADSPIITTLSAGSGSVGDSIDINGNNFGTRRRASAVTFNGTAATQVTFTNAKVTATVPTGATSGSVVVYDWEGTASNAVSFTVGDGTGTANGDVHYSGSGVQHRRRRRLGGWDRLRAGVPGRAEKERMAGNTGDRREPCERQPGGLHTWPFGGRPRTVGRGGHKPGRRNGAAAGRSCDRRSRRRRHLRAQRQCGASIRAAAVRRRVPLVCICQHRRGLLQHQRTAGRQHLRHSAFQYPRGLRL